MLQLMMNLYPSDMSYLFDEIKEHRERYKLLTTLHWKNNYRQAAFTVSRTDNSSRYELYWYTNEYGTKDKIERLYYLTKDGIFIEYGTEIYRIVEMAHYRPSSDIQVLLQLQDINEPVNYREFMGHRIRKPPIITPRQKGREQYADRGTYVRYSKK